MSNELAVKRYLENPETVQKFVNLYSAVHRGKNNNAVQSLELEKFAFLKEIEEKNLGECTPISIMGVFLDVISQGLTFSGADKYVYLVKRNVKNAASGAWEPRLSFSKSPDGKILVAQNSGVIERVSKPVMVYEGDVFGVKTNDKGEEVIVYEKAIPRKSEKIIAGFVHIVYTGGKREPFWMEQQDIARLAGYSKKQNGDRGANALYTSNNGQIDTGFFGAKLISHALKNVRKSAIASNINEIEGDQADAIAAGFEETQPEMKTEGILNAPLFKNQVHEIPENNQDHMAHIHQENNDIIDNPNSPF